MQKRFFILQVSSLDLTATREGHNLGLFPGQILHLIIRLPVLPGLGQEGSGNHDGGIGAGNDTDEQGQCKVVDAASGEDA